MGTVDGDGARIFLAGPARRRDPFICDLFSFPSGRVIVATSEPGARPFIAVVTGPDPQGKFKWGRRFVGYSPRPWELQKWWELQRWGLAADIPMLVWPLGAFTVPPIQPPPLVFDIRWGSDVPSGAYRSYFIYDGADGLALNEAFRRVDEVAVSAFFAGQRPALPSKPNRLHRRAPIKWDEEV